MFLPLVSKIFIPGILLTKEVVFLFLVGKVPPIKIFFQKSF